MYSFRTGNEGALDGILKISALLSVFRDVGTHIVLVKEEHDIYRS